MPTRKVKGNRGKNVKTKKRSFTKTGESYHDLCLLLAYIAQSRGSVTVNEALGDIDSLGATVRPGTCSDALNALQKMQVLAMSGNAAGTKTYHMRRYNFTNNPEMAQIDHVIQELRTDPLGELILVWLTKPAEGSKWPSATVSYKITAELLTAALGGHLWADNPAHQRAYYKNGRCLTLHSEEGKVLRDPDGNLQFAKAFADHTEVPHMFGRVGQALEIAHVGCTKGALTNATTMAAPEGEGRTIKTTDFQKFVSVSSITLEADQVDLLECGVTGIYNRLPVQRPEGGPGGKGKSAGPQRYEAIPEGTEIEFEITCPSKDFIKPSDMVKWLRLALPRLPRGISHARGAQGHGRMKLIRVDIMDWKRPEEGFQPLWSNGASEPEPETVE